MSETEMTSAPGTPESDKPKRTWREFLKRMILRLLVLGILVAACGVGLVYVSLRMSLPLQNGTVALEGLANAVIVERDDQGIPTISADNRRDAARVLGYLHAQDRFFQMDLLRRRSSGRLSQLLGASLVQVDEQVRKHRFSAMADSVWNALPEEHRQLLSEYTAGVNQGLNGLSGRPFEYFFLQQKPVPWENSDCLLVLCSMLLDLQDFDGEKEMGLIQLRELVPPELYDFLVRDGSEWDAAIDGSESVQPVPIPPAEVFSVRKMSALSATKDRAHVDSTVAHIRMQTSDFSAVFSPDYASRLWDDEAPGSNSWAVSSKYGRDGKALLANDMHLGLRVPTIWYRAVLKYKRDGQNRQLVGATLPGTPALIVGSNQFVAWGFTNSYLDLGDIVELTMVEGDARTYQTPSGPRELTEYTETMDVGSEQVEFRYDWSIWGPVVATIDDRKFVHRWVGNDPEAFNLNLLLLEESKSTEETLKLASQAGIPHNNIVAADSQGSIGWTVAGRLPKRTSGPAKQALDWSQSGSTWDGYLAWEEYPKVLDPEEGILWTANNRVLGGEYSEQFAGLFVVSGRAKQIRELLVEGKEENFDEEKLLRIQLDDRGTFHRDWHSWLVKALEGSASGQVEVSEEFQTLLKEWDGRTSPDSVAYGVLVMFRRKMMEQFFGGRGNRGNRGVVFSQFDLPDVPIPISYDAVMKDLLEQRPEHWLPSEFGTWDSMIVTIAAEIEQELTSRGPLLEQTWGKRNSVRIQHPISMAVPPLSSWLDMPTRQLPGAPGVPRVQGRSFGASQRMVVAPGEEESGIYHQPGGQSGHPLSPYYRKGFDDWAEGQPSALLPSEPVAKIVFQPES